MRWKIPSLRLISISKVTILWSFDLTLRSKSRIFSSVAGCSDWKEVILYLWQVVHLLLVAAADLLLVTAADLLLVTAVDLLDLCLLAAVDLLIVRRVDL
jgi:hypothetical protein